MNQTVSTDLITSLSIRSDTTYTSDTSIESDDTIFECYPQSIECIDTIFRKNGYIKLHKICDTLQGDLFNATTNDRETHVAIKRTSKYLYSNKIAVEDDINFCVSENIIKEALILKYLTVDNAPIGNYIVKYIDFFESSSDYFLVMEYVQNGLNLKQFIQKAQQYTKKGTLNIKSYKKMIKYVLWQLSVTLQWLHSSMHCCHLDLCLENILIVNAGFIESNCNGNVSVSIDPNISIKLCDFGVSEVFNLHNEFKYKYRCEKQGLSIENEQYFSPNVFNGEMFDARYADNWSLGIILYQCMTIGKQLYGPKDMYHSHSGYIALYEGHLKEYLVRNNLCQYFNDDVFSLLNGLLNVNERKRLKGMDVLSHKWFSMYFKRYHGRIIKKCVHQKQRLMDQQQVMSRFPYYC